MNKKNIIIIALMILAVWSLHGMDVLYSFSFASNMFDVNLMIAVISIMTMGMVALGDKK